MDTLGSECALKLGLKLYPWVAKPGWSVLSLADKPEREENSPGLLDARKRRMVNQMHAGRSHLLGEPKFNLFPNF